MAIAGVVAESFAKAEIYLRELADLNISSQRIRRITRRRGQDRLRLRDRLTAYYESCSIPDQLHRVPDGVRAPSMAVVSFDGGRYQVLDRRAEATEQRDERVPSGLRRKGSHWKESRVACVMSMEGTQHETDPMPDLPDFLAGGTELQRKLTEIGCVMSMPAVMATEKQADCEDALRNGSPRRSRRRHLAPSERPLPGPELVHRDCIASAMSWRDFGVAVAAEAWSRGFAGAKLKVCICDGSDAIRRVCETQFSDYIHVLDLMHALSYSMHAARGVGGSRQDIEGRYRRWAETIWQGRVGELIEELKEHQRSLGDPPKDASADDPREAIRTARVYYENQKSRMDYPRYRRLGLPLTSSLMESTVKQLSRRVKGSEKFWSPTGGDELLTLRGDLISDSDRLSKFLAQYAGPNDGTRSYACAA